MQRLLEKHTHTKNLRKREYSCLLWRAQPVKFWWTQKRRNVEQKSKTNRVVYVFFWALIYPVFSLRDFMICLSAHTFGVAVIISTLYISFFLLAIQLNIHQNRHNNVYHKCPECGKHFLIKSNLTKHIQSHTGKRDSFKL